jgi:hypothetical protein
MRVRKTYNYTYPGGSFNTGGNNASTAFQVNTLAEFPQLSVLWDSYRIDKIKVTLTPNYDSVDAGNVATSIIGGAQFKQPVASVVDYDDDIALTFVQLANYGTVRYHTLDKQISRTFKPRALGMVYQGLTGTGYSQLPRPTWIDCAYPNVLYYGFKFATKNPVPAGFQWDARITYWCSFKGAR